jgi:hypothetical protein
MLGRDMEGGLIPGVAPTLVKLVWSYPRLHAAIPPGFKSDRRLATQGRLRRLRNPGPRRRDVSI